MRTTRQPRDWPGRSQHVGPSMASHAGASAPRGPLAFPDALQGSPNELVRMIFAMTSGAGAKCCCRFEIFLAADLVWTGALADYWCPQGSPTVHRLAKKHSSG